MLLIGILLIIVVIYFVQNNYPILAGLIAVIPVKIIATSVFAHDRGLLKESISGMLVGQFVIGFILLIIYIKLG